MHVKALVPDQPLLHLRMFVGRIIVGDEVQLYPLGSFPVDAFEELEPLLTAMLVSHQRAGTANSDRGLSGGSVLPQP
jgi:hypothetical protein